MPLSFKNKTVCFLGLVGIEDTEALLEWLLKNPAGKADLLTCTHLHASNLQVLMAAHTVVSRWPVDQGLAVWLQTVLKEKKHAV